LAVIKTNIGTKRQHFSRVDFSVKGVWYNIW